MNYDYHNYYGENIEVIEIISSHSALNLLRRSGNKSIKICLPLELSIGKLDFQSLFYRSNLLKYRKNIYL